LAAANMLDHDEAVSPCPGSGRISTT
jgi:hypothetical protein